VSAHRYKNSPDRKTLKSGDESYRTGKLTHAARQNKLNPQGLLNLQQPLFFVFRRAVGCQPTGTKTALIARRSKVEMNRIVPAS